MKRIFYSILSFLLLVPLAGCGESTWLPYAREMGNMALVQTLGIDRDEGGWTLTVSTGPRPAGGEGEEKDALVRSASGVSLPAAQLAVEGLSDAEVFCAYAKQLLLGEELAREDITPVLDYLAQAVEMDLGMELWVICGAQAQQALNGAGSEGAAPRLEQLNTDAEEGRANLTRTAGEVLTALADCGSTWLPALTLEEKGEGETSLRSQGYAILRQGKLVGFAQGRAAQGLELLESRGFGRIVDLELEDGTPVSLRLERVRTGCEPEFEGQELKGLSVTCAISAQVVQTPRTLERSELEQLGRLLERGEEEQIAAALELTQNLDADFTGLFRKTGMSAPERWSRLREQWAEAFSALHIRVETRCRVERARGAAG